MEPLSKGHQNLIRIFGTYGQYHIHDNEPIGDELVRFTNDNVNKFRIVGYDTFRRLSMAELVNPRPDSTTLSPNQYYPVENFSRCIKHDSTLFTDLKIQATCYNWNHNVIVTTCAQNIEDVFHEAYVPPTSDDISLSKGKKYMYSFF